jgi:hypothetical protein
MGYGIGRSRCRNRSFKSTKARFIQLSTDWKKGMAASGMEAIGNRARSQVLFPDENNLQPKRTVGRRLTGGTGTGYQYAAAGNQKSTGSRASLGVQANTYNYDAENRLTSANIGGAGSATYIYMAKAGGCRRPWAPAVTSYVYDAGGSLVAEYSTAIPPVTGTEWLADDHLGSTRLVMTGTGIVKRYDYLPFGEEIPQGQGGRGAAYGTQAPVPGSPDLVSEKFTSKERDSETGLDYFGARYFSSAPGQVH